MILSLKKNATKKGRIGALYKTYRNLIVTLIRKSKKKYYADFFHEHQNNLKKTWDGIRDLINVSKKSSININKLIHEDRTITDNKTITQTITQTIPGGTTQNQHTNNTQYKTNNTKITKNKQAIH